LKATYTIAEGRLQIADSLLIAEASMLKVESAEEG
jgi:hypothetical protein